MENTAPRVLGYQLATELSVEELDSVSGGSSESNLFSLQQTYSVTGNSFNGPDMGWDFRF